MKRCFIAISIVAILFVSCPIFFHSDMTKLKKLEGKRIINYPEWITDKNPRYYNPCSIFISDDNFSDLLHAYRLYLGSSDWIKCDSSNVGSILNLISDDIIDRNYDGYFRIDLYGQYIVVYFDKLSEDEELVGKYFYNWLGDVKFISDIDIEIEQEDDEHFSYNSYLKKSLYESADENKRTKITFTKLNDNKYNYRIDFSNNDFFECEIYNPRNMMSKRVVDFDFINNGFPVSYSITNQTEDRFLFEFLSGDIFLFDSDSDGKFFFSPSGYVNSKWFIDGASLKEFNQSQSKVLLNVFGCNGEKVDYADYFEIHVKAKDDVELTFYKLNEEEQPIVVQSYSKPELVWEWK